MKNYISSVVTFALCLLLHSPYSYATSGYAKETEIPKNLEQTLKSLNLLKAADYTGTYSPSGKLYAVFEGINHRNDGFIARIWDVKSGKLKYSLTSDVPELSNVISLTFNKDETILAFGGMFDGVLLWHFVEGDKLVKSCFDAMGALIHDFTEDNQIIYMSTADSHYKLCSTTSNHVYLTQKGGAGAEVLTSKRKLLFIYPTQFEPYRTDDPYGFSWRHQDPNSESDEVMKSYLDIWELNKKPTEGFDRYSLIDSENDYYIMLEFHLTETVIEQWDYETRKRNFTKKLPALKYEYVAGIETDYPNNRFLIKGEHKQMLVNSKTGELISHMPVPPPKW